MTVRPRGRPAGSAPGFRPAPARRTACGALARAGSSSFATALPPLDGPAAKLWVEASLERPVARQVLLGDARALQRELKVTREGLSQRTGIPVAELPRAAPPAPAPPTRLGSPVPHPLD